MKKLFHDLLGIPKDTSKAEVAAACFCLASPLRQSLEKQEPRKVSLNPSPINILRAKLLLDSR